MLYWLQRIGAQNCTDAQQMALAAMYHGEEITNERYRALTSISDSRTVTTQLGQLVADGFIKKNSDRRWASYELADDVYSLTDTTGEGVNEGTSEGVNDGARAERVSLQARRRQAILDLLAAEDAARVPRIVEQLGHPRSTIERDIRALVNEGKIAFHGPNKTGGYKLCGPDNAA